MLPQENSTFLPPILYTSHIATFPLTSHWPGSDLGEASRAGLKPKVTLSMTLDHCCEDMRLNRLPTASRKLLQGRAILFLLILSSE